VVFHCLRSFFVQAVQTVRASPIQEFTADLKHGMRDVWKDAESVDPNARNNKLATCYFWFAIPFSSNERIMMPTIVPQRNGRAVTACQRHTEARRKLRNPKEVISRCAESYTSP